MINMRPIWMLTKVTDRNGNNLTLTWTPFNSNKQIRSFKVVDAQGRYPQFSYDATYQTKITSVAAVTGAISRSVSYTYCNSDSSDLATYTDPKGKLPLTFMLMHLIR